MVSSNQSLKCTKKENIIHIAVAAFDKTLTKENFSSLKYILTNVHIKTNLFTFKIMNRISILEYSSKESKKTQFFFAKTSLS